MEGDIAQYPVNQWIVVGEPVVSKNHRHRWVKQKHKEIKSHELTRREFHRELESFCNNRVGSCSVKEFDLNGVNGDNGKVVAMCKLGIYEAMTRAGVDICGERSFGVGDERRGEGNVKGIGAGMSGRV